MQKDFTCRLLQFDRGSGILPRRAIVRVGGYVLAAVGPVFSVTHGANICSAHERRVSAEQYTFVRWPLVFRRSVVGA